MRGGERSGGISPGDDVDGEVVGDESAVPGTLVGDGEFGGLDFEAEIVLAGGEEEGVGDGSPPGGVALGGGVLGVSGFGFEENEVAAEVDLEGGPVWGMQGEGVVVDVVDEGEEGEVLADEVVAGARGEAEADAVVRAAPIGGGDADEDGVGGEGGVVGAEGGGDEAGAWAGGDEDGGVLGDVALAWGEFEAGGCGVGGGGDGRIGGKGVCIDGPGDGGGSEGG